MKPETETIREAIAATLESIAEWPSLDPDKLYEIAKEVRSCNLSDRPCCPICEEVDCDEGCALEKIRQEIRRNENILSGDGCK